MTSRPYITSRRHTVVTKYGFITTNLHIWRHDHISTHRAPWPAIYTYGTMTTHLHIWRHDITSTHITSLPHMRLQHLMSWPQTVISRCDVLTACVVMNTFYVIAALDLMTKCFCHVVMFRSCPISSWSHMKSWIYMTSWPHVMTMLISLALFQVNSCSVVCTQKNDCFMSTIVYSIVEAQCFFLNLYMNLSQVCIENKYEYKFTFNILKLSIGDLLRKVYLHSILMKMFGYFQDVLS